VSIRATSGGLPTGGDLASGSIAASSLISTWSPATWYDFDLGDGCFLQANTKYAIVVRLPNGTSTNTLYNWCNTAGTYAGGNVVFSSNSGSSWSVSAYSSWDMLFEEWGFLQ
jgi:hypothetical protein